MTTIVGVVFRPQFPPERLRPVVEEADRVGLEELWIWEDCFLEGGVATASAALAWSERLTLGIGVFPVPLRNVALTAMEVAALHRMHGGRVRVGVGHGVLDWMGQVGERVASPMALLAEYVTALRSLLAGDEVNTSGRYVRLDRVALDWPPIGPVPVLVAAIGPRTLRLAGEIGDGTVLTGGTTPEQVAAAVDEIEAGRQAGGRTDRHEVVVYLTVATGPDAERRLEAERDRVGLAAGDYFGVAGEAPEVAEAVTRLAAHGATCVALVPTADEADPEGFVRVAAEAVRPLLD